MEETKICTRCKKILLFEDFKVNRRTGQVTKQCIKCLDIQKKSTDKNKCKHQKRKNVCFECGGVGICEHQKRRSRCKDCRGSEICQHQKQKSTCKDCGGGSICEHLRQRSRCKECGGGSICEHQKRRSRCIDCGGGSMCVHNIQKHQCKICDPKGHLANSVKNIVKYALKSKKTMHSLEYLGCSIGIFKQHIDSQFKEGMTWENHGEWHIDHKIPLKYKQDGISPTIEEVAKRLHYTNTQPLWASENISKGNRYIS